MNIRFGLAAVVLALAGATQANAAAAGDAALAEILPHVPRDADGKVTREAFVAYMETAFDRADTAKSGQIDPARLKRASAARVCSPMFGPRYVPGASLTGC
ncbi:hypothetical protein FHW96_002781 [Novosphingobium sp. SG751A]|uniref:hypothetical protein n=1 Tax=Novosphingobium sp. SG751A TaxID=2587000 RepID=UPI001554ACDC|nr:hypothetical protein [Novosphingobium sp. SG751A]NOW46621.1 hypothetical protein [Novosphingobium sp. SG751A]